MSTIQELISRAAASTTGAGASTRGAVTDEDASAASSRPLQGGADEGPPLHTDAPRHDETRRPPGMSALDLDSALDRLERLAFTLDSKWALGRTGIRVGTDTVLGLIPVLGDVLSTGYAAYIVLHADMLGMPVDKQKRMWFRVVKDAVFGTVPLLGTAVDAWYKANERNVNDILTHFGRPTMDEQRKQREGMRAVANQGAPGGAPPPLPGPHKRRWRLRVS